MRIIQIFILTLFLSSCSDEPINPNWAQDLGQFWNNHYAQQRQYQQQQNQYYDQQRRQQRDLVKTCRTRPLPGGRVELWCQ